MTTESDVPLEGKGASNTILYAPTTSQMREKFTFHQHGQLAHLNVVMQLQKQADASRPHTDAVEASDAMEQKASHPSGDGMTYADRDERQEQELERARQIIDDYVEALRACPTASPSRQASSDGSRSGIAASSKPPLPTRPVLNKPVDASSVSLPPPQQQKRSSLLDENVRVNPSPRADESHHRPEGSVQQLRKRSLPLTLRPSAKQKTSPPSNTDK